MEDMQEIIRKTIRAYKGAFTNEALAELLDISSASVSNKLNGKTDFSYPEVEALKKFLNIK